MLEAVEGTEVWVSGESGSPADSLPGIPPTVPEIILLADDGLLDEMALALAEEEAQGLVLLSEDEGTASRLRSLPLKGWGLVTPDAPPEELGAAVAAAAQGLVVLSKAAAGQAIGEVTVVEELSEPPTTREGEVLGLLAQGLSNKKIARELHISEHTVKFHISSLYAKLGVSNRAEAVSQGARHGLISL